MGVNAKKIVEDMTQDWDKPFELADSWSFLKRGKIRIIMIYEDLSFKEYFVKMKNDYTFDIKKKSYLIIPECLIRGKYSTFLYYYNNPMPLKFKHQVSKLKTPKDSPIETAVEIDAKALNVAFNSNLINKMYQEVGFWSTKNIIIILVVVVIVVLVLLQVTGTVDVMAFISGVGNK